MEMLADPLQQLSQWVLISFISHSSDLPSDTEIPTSQYHPPPYHYYPDHTSVGPFWKFCKLCILERYMGVRLMNNAQMKRGFSATAPPASDTFTE